MKKRELLFKRIMTQMNSFLESYKLFNNQFIFKGKPLKEYLQDQLGHLSWYKTILEEARQENPGKMKDIENAIK